MKILKQILHKIEHIMSWYYVEIETKRDDKGNLWMSAVCIQCGERSGVHQLNESMLEQL